MQPLTGYYQGDTHKQQKYSIDATFDWILPGGYTQTTKIFNRCNHWLDITRENFTTHNQPKYSIAATIDWILPGGILLHKTNQNIHKMQPLAGYYQGEFNYTQPNKIFNRCNHWLDTTRGNFTTNNQPKYSIDWIIPRGISLQITNQNIREIPPLAGNYKGEVFITQNQLYITQTTNVPSITMQLIV